jgi:hypothetical protein
MASKDNNEVREIALARCLGSRMPLFSDDEVLLLLRAAIECEGGRAAFAKHHGIDRIYLNMVLNGGRSVGGPIVKALGLRRAYVVEPMLTDCDKVRSTTHPTPWSIQETAACFAVRDHNGQVVTSISKLNPADGRSSRYSRAMRRGNCWLYSRAARAVA